MSKKEKLIERFKRMPKDFTYQEVTVLLSYFGYEEKQGAGSRVAFFNKETENIIYLHKPHPGNIIKQYMMKDIKKTLEERGLI